MNRRALLLALTAPAWLAAQAPGDPLTLLRVVQTAAKPAGDLVNAYRGAAGSAEVIGLTALTGPSLTWIVEAHGSFASLEALDQALPVAARSGEGFPGETTRMLAIHRPYLSYRPDEAAKGLSTARYVQLTMLHAPPGSKVEVAELIAIRRLTLDSINVDRPELGYQVISGMPSGTYLFVAPLATLRTLDQALARLPVYAEPVAKSARQASAESEIRREQYLLRVDPALSVVSEQFAAPAPQFWRGGGER